jgi:hypothetical protein
MCIAYSSACPNVPEADPPFGPDASTHLPDLPKSGRRYHCVMRSGPGADVYVPAISRSARARQASARTLSRVPDLSPAAAV